MDSGGAMKNLLLTGAVVLLLSGCGTPPKYYWGNYEGLIYTQYGEPGKATPEYQIIKLEEDIQRARSKNQPLPPGFFAHLGYQYVAAGKGAEARQSFETEKRLFPESAPFLNRFTAPKGMNPKPAASAEGVAKPVSTPTSKKK